MTRRWLRGWLCALWAVSPGALSAETLNEALAKAYRTNPDLTAARAGLRATDADVAIARAAGRPNVNGSASVTENALQADGNRTFSLTPDRSLNSDLQLRVPIYSGGAVRNSVRAADSRVEAGRADLRATESALFSEVVAAYMNVLRDEAVVDLNQANVRVLTTNLAATRDRFEIGDVTRTDVAQSEARLALAEGTLESARANLIGSRELYLRLVGTPPQALAPPPPLPGLPASADTAVTVALADNPDLIAAKEAVTAAGFDVRVAGAERLPSLAAVTGANYQNYFGSIDTGGTAVSVDNSALTGQVGVQATLPIFQGGRPAARVRQSNARLGQAQEREIAVERAVIAQTRAAFASFAASDVVIRSAQRAVLANELSLEGVRAENSVGNRTILDILDAEQELLSSRVQLVTARRDGYVAAFSLLAAMGRAEARDLNLDSGALYDPAVHYQAVRGQWSDFADGDAPAREASRTIDSPAQDAALTEPAQSGEPLQTGIGVN